jgi:hypothetical protein
VQLSAHAELHRDGFFGPQCLGLLTRLMRREARKVAVLEPPGGWSDHAFDDLVQEFFSAKGKGVTRMLFAQAADDDQLGALLCRSVKNWLIDWARSETDLGALRHRLDKLLRTLPAFARVPDGQPGAGRWALADGSGGVFAGDVEDLARAGRAVSVTPGAWSSDERRAPVTDKASLVRLLERIFDAAGGSLELGQIVYAVQGSFHARFAAEVVFDHSAEPSSRLAKAFEVAETTEPRQTKESEARIELMARRLLDSLSDDGVRILDVLDDPAEVAARLGVGRSQAYAKKRAATAVLAELIGDDPDRAAIFATARGIAQGRAA